MKEEYILDYEKSKGQVVINDGMKKEFKELFSGCHINFLLGAGYSYGILNTLNNLVNNEDIRAIGKAVAFIDKTSYEMISVLPQGACIFTGISSNFPVLIQVDLLPEELRPHSDTIDLIELWNS